MPKGSSSRPRGQLEQESIKETAAALEASWLSSQRRGPDRQAAGGGHIWGVAEDISAESPLGFLDFPSSRELMVRGPSPRSASSWCQAVVREGSSEGVGRAGRGKTRFSRLNELPLAWEPNRIGFYGNSTACWPRETALELTRPSRGFAIRNF